MPIESLSHEIMEEALDFAEKSHIDSAWQDYYFDRSILRRNLEGMVGNSNYFTCVYRKQGVIVGYFFATLGVFLFSDVLLGMESGIYIDKEHRGGSVAFKMFRAFTDWCQKMNAEPLVEIYFGTDGDNEKTYQFFRKAGMFECGRVFRGGRNGLR